MAGPEVAELNVLKIIYKSPNDQRRIHPSINPAATGFQSTSCVICHISAFSPEIYAEIFKNEYEMFTDLLNKSPLKDDFHMFSSCLKQTSEINEDN